MRSRYKFCVSLEPKISTHLLNVPGLPLRNTERVGEWHEKKNTISIVVRLVFSGTPLAFSRADRLRKRMTLPERILWKKIRAKRFHKIRFRRQAPIGIYIVDFLCKEAMLVIEVDGGSHFEEGAKEYDENRTAFLESKGLKVLRFTNGQVRTNLEWVLTRIREEVLKRSPP